MLAIKARVPTVRAAAGVAAVATVQRGSSSVQALTPTSLLASLGHMSHPSSLRAFSSDSNSASSSVDSKRIETEIAAKMQAFSSAKSVDPIERTNAPASLPPLPPLVRKKARVYKPKKRSRAAIKAERKIIRRSKRRRHQERIRQYNIAIKKPLAPIRWIEKENLKTPSGSELSLDLRKIDAQKCVEWCSEEIEVLYDEIITHATEEKYFTTDLLDKAVNFTSTRGDVTIFGNILVAARNSLVSFPVEHVPTLLDRCLKAGSPLMMVRLLPNKDRYRLPMHKREFHRLLYRLCCDLELPSTAATRIEDGVEVYSAYVTNGPFTCVATYSDGAVQSTVPSEENADSAAKSAVATTAVVASPLSDFKAQLAALDTVFKVFYLMCMDYRHAPDHITYSILINSALAVFERPAADAVSNEDIVMVRSEALRLATMAIEEASLAMKLRVTPKTLERYIKAVSEATSPSSSQTGAEAHKKAWHVTVGSLVRDQAELGLSSVNMGSSLHALLKSRFDNISSSSNVPMDTAEELLSLMEATAALNQHQPVWTTPEQAQLATTWTLQLASAFATHKLSPQSPIRKRMIAMAAKLKMNAALINGALDRTA